MIGKLGTKVKKKENGYEEEMENKMRDRRKEALEDKVNEVCLEFRNAKDDLL